MIRFYLLMCVLGLILPYAAFFGWLLSDGTLSFQRVWEDIVVSRLSLMAWLDVLVTAVVLITFIRHEGRKQQISSLAAPIVGTCLVGPSFGLPLFLLLRQRAIVKSRNEAA